MPGLLFFADLIYSGVLDMCRINVRWFGLIFTGVLILRLMCSSTDVYYAAQFCLLFMCLRLDKCKPWVDPVW